MGLVLLVRLGEPGRAGEPAASALGGPVVERSGRFAACRVGRGARRAAREALAAAGAEGVWVSGAEGDDEAGDGDDEEVQSGAEDDSTVWWSASDGRAVALALPAASVWLDSGCAEAREEAAWKISRALRVSGRVRHVLFQRSRTLVVLALPPPPPRDAVAADTASELPGEVAQDDEWDADGEDGAAVTTAAPAVAVPSSQAPPPAAAAPAERTGWGNSRVKTRDRFGSLVRWLLARHGSTALRAGCGVLDVAGGKGDLAIKLTLQARVPATIVDPRPMDVPNMLRHVTRKAIERLLREQHTVGASALPELHVPWPRHIRCWFSYPLDGEGGGAPSASCGDYAGEALHDSADARAALRGALERCSALVGMHPDQATEAIVDWGVALGRPFACVPCCVFPNLFVHRSHVRSHAAFVEWLVRKYPGRVQRDALPFAGRSDVVCEAGRAPPNVFALHSGVQEQAQEQAQERAHAHPSEAAPSPAAPAAPADHAADHAAERGSAVGKSRRVADSVVVPSWSPLAAHLREAGEDHGDVVDSDPGFAVNGSLAEELAGVAAEPALPAAAAVGKKEEDDAAAVVVVAMPSQLVEPRPLRRVVGPRQRLNDSEPALASLAWALALALIAAAAASPGLALLLAVAGAVAAVARSPAEGKDAEELQHDAATLETRLTAAMQAVREVELHRRGYSLAEPRGVPLARIELAAFGSGGLGSLECVPLRRAVAAAAAAASSAYQRELQGPPCLPATTPCRPEAELLLCELDRALARLARHRAAFFKRVMLGLAPGPTRCCALRRALVLAAADVAAAVPTPTVALSPTSAGGAALAERSSSACGRLLAAFAQALGDSQAQSRGVSAALLAARERAVLRLEARVELAGPLTEQDASELLGELEQLGRAASAAHAQLCAQLGALERLVRTGSLADNSAAASSSQGEEADLEEGAEEGVAEGVRATATATAVGAAQEVTEVFIAVVAPTTRERPKRGDSDQDKDSVRAGADGLRNSNVVLSELSQVLTCRRAQLVPERIVRGADLVDAASPPDAPEAATQEPPQLIATGLSASETLLLLGQLKSRWALLPRSQDYVLSASCDSEEEQEEEEEEERRIDHPSRSRVQTCKSGG
jgi:hypothetical protein